MFYLYCVALMIKTNADVDATIGATAKEFAKQFSFEELPLLTHCIYEHVVSTRRDLIDILQPIHQKLFDERFPIGRWLTEKDRDTLWVMLGKIARNKYALTGVLENFHQQSQKRIEGTLQKTSKVTSQQQLGTIMRDHIQWALDRLFKGKPAVVLYDYEYYYREGWALFDLTWDGIWPILEKHYPEVTKIDSPLLFDEVEKLIDSLLEIKELPEQEAIAVRYRGWAKLQKKLLG